MPSPDPLNLITGSEALAYGALEAGVHLVTGYPGSPVTAVVEDFARLSEDPARVVWAINEKSAADNALGITLAGRRALLCVKSPGLNVALDCLMVANLSPGDGGLVILVGDDPGGWGSQNEEDSRLLIQALEIPMLEPTSVVQARQMMRYAFDLSEELVIPVAIRVIHALTVDQGCGSFVRSSLPGQKPREFVRRRDRWTVLPTQVVSLHNHLQFKIKQVRKRFETSPFNGQTGEGRLGLIVGGYAQRKLQVVLEESSRQNFEQHVTAGNVNPANRSNQSIGLLARILQLGTLYPLPEELIINFLRQVDEVLVIEEIAPVLETNVRAFAQRAGLALPVYGRDRGQLPGTGELTSEVISQALAVHLPDWKRPVTKTQPRDMISRKPFCEGCPYIPIFDALIDLMEKHGGRNRYIVVGETGCLVRGQLPPWEMLDVKYSMGSSIGIASGMQRAGIPQKVIALSGDSAFLHSGIGELVDAVQGGRDLLVVILENNTTALTGGQPHPATRRTDRAGDRVIALDLAALVRVAGVNTLCVVDPLDKEAIIAALEESLMGSGVNVVISRRACPIY